jgi:hypothetical protein
MENSSKRKNYKPNQLFLIEVQVLGLHLLVDYSHQIVRGLARIILIECFSLSYEGLYGFD